MTDERLLGELTEFKRMTIEELKELRKEVRALMNFKWKATGVLGALMVVVEATIHVFRH